MKLKLTDKIKKFFGTRAVDGDEPLAGLQQLPQLDGHTAYTEGARLSCFAAKVDSVALPSGSGALNYPNVQHGIEKVHMPSTVSQKADLASNPRTTGQDEAYCLQNEVYFPQLLLTLQTGSPEQKAVAAEALFNYTAESDAARQRATQAGVVAYLIDLLKLGTDHGKMYAAYTLSSLTSIEEALDQMCLMGAIPALISILSTCPLLVCKKGAMRALGRLARNDQAAADIVAANGLVPIIGLLNRPDSSLVRRCLIALYFIGADKDALQQAIGAAGALPSLLNLACSDSPDVQAEATDVLKVLCRNVTCGHSLAELGGIDVLAGLVHTGLTSRTKASAARALQRLDDIPDLREQLASSSARDVLSEGSKCSSLLNTSTAAAAFGQAAAAAPHDSIAAGAVFAGNGVGSMNAAVRNSTPPAAALAAGLEQLSLEKEKAAAAVPTAQILPAAGLPDASAAAEDDAAAAEVDDVKQLAEVLANPTNKRLREKAAAAVEQLAIDDPEACRQLADMGALGSLLNMLAAGNSSATRRAGARALGKLGDDALMITRMAEPAFITKLLQAAPELNGSALRAVLKLLQALAADEHTRTAFPRHNCAAHLMQVLEGMQAGNTAVSDAGAAAAPAAVKGVGLAGTSTRADLAAGVDVHGVDVAAAVRVLDVLLALCEAEPAVLTEVKLYPGGLRLLVSKLQPGPSAVAQPILQLLACLARSKDHQEDLLKGGVVPVLLGLYRGDDVSIAMQAAKVMELLSEPAAQILERSLSKGDMAANTPAVVGGTAAGAEKAGAGNLVSPFQAGSSVLQGNSSSSNPPAQGSGSVTGETGTQLPGSTVRDRQRSIEAAQPSSSSTAKAELGSSSPGRYNSPSRAAAAAAAESPAGSAARASSLANTSCTNALSRLNVGKSSKSFSAQPEQAAADGGRLVIGDASGGPNARSSSPFRGQQQQQQRQELAASKLPKRPATPEEGSSSSKQELVPPAIGSSKPSVGDVPALPSVAAAASNRAVLINKDRPPSAGVESPVRPGSASKSKPATPTRNSPSAAQRQRLMAIKKPSSPSFQKAAASPMPVVEAPSQQQPQLQPQATPQQQQQPQYGRDAAAEVGPQQPVPQVAAASQEAADAVAGGSAPNSPTQRPSAKQQQQQRAAQGSPVLGEGAVAGATPAAPMPDTAKPAVAPAVPEANHPAGVAAASAAPPAEAGRLAAADGSSRAQQDKVLPNVAAAGSAATAADADELLSSTYDNLHGLLMKKSDIEICRTVEGRKCRLGEGGFGVVYKAVMNGVDEVAVKLVKADSPSRKELELFLKEVQTLAKLHHRNIVQFYGACLETGSMFFVTELMKGGDLYTALRHHSETMKWERLGRKVALDVALGLNYLHAQRPPMMHRDLKSPNVLLSEEGVAKIADVGMVRSQVKDLVTAQPVMTPLWAAPEVVRHERASIKADIWSYGILIWELISGEDITEYQPLSISRQVGPSPNAKAMTLPAKCPAVARKLFTACTQMDPEKRPGAQVLVEWLRADMAQNRF